MPSKNIAGSIENLSGIDGVASAMLVYFGDIRYNPGGSCGPRNQLDFQLVIIYEGEALISVDETEFWLGPGQVALMKPGCREFFQFSRTQATHHSWCAVDPSRVEPALASRLTQTPPSLRLSARMASLIELGLNTPTPGSLAIRDWRDSLGEACLRAYLMESESGVAPPLPEAILRARSAIETRFAEPLSLDTLARVASVSPNHLVRLFQRHLKTTPARLLWKCRVKHGTQLLADTGLTVAEIAYRTGFQNPFHFSRMVKAETGLSPRELRKERWNMQKPSDSNFKM